jgi:hypothetical protein
MRHRRPLVILSAAKDLASADREARSFAALRMTGSAVVVALSIATQTLAATPTTNPAVERFNRAVTFYLSFENGLHAEMALGKPEPTRVEGDATFKSGLHGQAVLLDNPGATAMLWYSTLGGNVDLTKPGAMALWISPQGWVRSENEDYFFPAKIMSSYAQLMFGRQGRLKEGRTDYIYLWCKVGDSKEILVGGGDSLKWENGQWHLWVMNWRSGSIEFSLDGGPPQRMDTPVRFNSGWDSKGHSHLLLGAQGEGTHYLLDEVLVLNRPLDEQEIKWIYDEGMKQAQAAQQAEKSK